MKVKLLKEIACPFGTFKAGSEPDLPDEIANGLLNANYAELVEVNKEVKSEFPKHKGFGIYELSNGEEVKGKEAALEAQKALKVGE